MSDILATQIVHEFESGRISRRQLVARLMGLGAAVASMNGGSIPAQQAGEVAIQSAGQGAATTRPSESGQPGATTESTFQATGLHHIAIDVTDVARSRDFYVKHLGLSVIRGDENAMFLGQGRGFFLTLFRREKAGLHHYSYAIPSYDPDAAFARLGAAGLRPRREGARIYFPDPDGITVQISKTSAT
jgi:catechol 2,3-dioxygenase-like lactoylglutathione lyase family enzyme